MKLISKSLILSAALAAFPALTAAADCGNGETEWFTLQGIRVTAPAEPGVYIRRQNGRALKIRVR